MAFKNLLIEIQALHQVYSLKTSFGNFGLASTKLYSWGSSVALALKWNALRNAIPTQGTDRGCKAPASSEAFSLKSGQLFAHSKSHHISSTCQFSSGMRVLLPCSTIWIMLKMNPNWLILENLDYGFNYQTFFVKSQKQNGVQDGRTPRQIRFLCTEILKNPRFSRGKTT